MKYIGHALLILLVGVLTGLLAYWLDSAGLYFIVLIPLGMGALLSSAVVFPSAYYDPPKAWLFVVGLIGFVALFGTFWGVPYNAYMSDLRADILDDDEKLTPVEVNEIIFEEQEDDYGVSGFQAYLAQVADIGFTIDLDPPLDVTGQGAYIYWGIEMTVVALITFGGIFRVDNNPYLVNIRQNRQLKASRPDELDAI